MSRSRDVSIKSKSLIVIQIRPKTKVEKLARSKNRFARRQR